MMDLTSLYMLLQGGGTGYRPQQQPQQQGGLPIMGRMGRMTGGGLGFGGQGMDPAWLDNPTFGASAYKNVPVSYGGTPMHPDMVGNSGMPILNASSAPQPGQQPAQGQQANGMDLLMASGGLNMLFDALRGS